MAAGAKGCFMKQKHPDLCGVPSLIDYSGPRLHGVCCVLSEYLAERWEDKNHSLKQDATEAARPTQTVSEGKGKCCSEKEYSSKVPT